MCRLYNSKDSLRRDYKTTCLRIVNKIELEFNWISTLFISVSVSGIVLSSNVFPVTCLPCLPAVDQLVPFSVQSGLTRTKTWVGLLYSLEFCAKVFMSMSIRVLWCLECSWSQIQFLIHSTHFITIPCVLTRRESKIVSLNDFFLHVDFDLEQYTICNYI